jgi:hypothetical protein
MGTISVIGVRSPEGGRLRRKLRCLVTALFCWGVSGTIASADVITVFDNYKPNFGAATFDGQVINPLGPQRDRDFANGFVPTQSGPLAQIWATVTMVSGVNEVDLWLMADNNGAPGNVLEAWNLTNAMPLRGGLNTPLYVQSDGNTFLEAGELYWLVASAPLPTVAQWMFNGINDRGPTSFRENGGSWQTPPGPLSDLRGAFRVDIVPEPATLCIMAMGALTLLRRRRTRIEP